MHHAAQENMLEWMIMRPWMPCRREAKKLNNEKLICAVTLNDINAASKSRLKDKAVKGKHKIYELDASRTLRTLLLDSEHATWQG